MSATEKVNVILGISEGIVTDIEAFATTAHGEKQARSCFRNLCKSFGVSERKPYNDDKDVRWFITKLQQQ